MTFLAYLKNFKKKNVFLIIHIIKERSANTDPKSKMRILFLGSDDFSTSILKTITKFPKLKVDVLGPSADTVFYNNKHIKTQVIPKIIEYSSSNNLTYSQDINTYKQDILDRKYDMLITASFNAFIDKTIINKFPMNRCINIHPSLLPYYKGAAPIQRTLLDNAKYTGVTIQTLHPDKFDHGKILLQSSPILTDTFCNDFDKKISWKSIYKMNSIFIKKEETFNEEDNKYRLKQNDDKTGIYFNEKYSHLRNSLTIVGSKLMHELFNNDNYMHIQPCENNKLICGEKLENKKFSSKLTILDFDIDWNSKTASELEYIGNITNEKIYTYFKKVPIKNRTKQPWIPEKIFLSNLKSLDKYEPINDDCEVGMFEIKENKIVIKCKSNTYIECGGVRPADKPDFITIPKFEKLIKKNYKQRVLKFNSLTDVISEYKDLKSNDDSGVVRIAAVEDMIRLKASSKNKSKYKTLYL